MHQYCNEIITSHLYFIIVAVWYISRMNMNVSVIFPNAQLFEIMIIMIAKTENWKVTPVVLDQNPCKHKHLNWLSVF